MGSYVESKLPALKTLADEYLRVISGLMGRNGVTRYELDTGQGRQSVTAADVPELQTTYNTLLQQIDLLEDRVNGQSVFIGRPGY